MAYNFKGNPEFSPSLSLIGALKNISSSNLQIWHGPILILNFHCGNLLGRQGHLLRRTAVLSARQLATLPKYCTAFFLPLYWQGTRDHCHISQFHMVSVWAKVSSRRTLVRGEVNGLLVTSTRQPLHNKGNRSALSEGRGSYIQRGWNKERTLIILMLFRRGSSISGV